jgi:hypothetical protein
MTHQKAECCFKTRLKTKENHEDSRLNRLQSGRVWKQIPPGNNSGTTY